MKVERYSPKRKRSPWLGLGCGCLSAAILITIGVVVVIFVITRGPQIALESAGFSDLGDTNTLFNEAAPTLAPLSAPQATPETLVINAGEYIQEAFDTNDFTVEVGESVAGTEIRVTFTEQDMLRLCQQQSTVCSNSNEAIRNARFDLRNSGLIVYADVLVPQLNTYQSIGVVMQLLQTRLVVSGVDYNGRTYATPPNELGTTISDMEYLANDLIRQFSAQAGGETYSLTEVYADDNQLTLVLR